MSAGAWRPNSRRWQVAPPYAGADELARQIGSSSLVAQILHNRGLTSADEAKAFLDPKLTDLHDPSELPGAVEAARILAEAARTGRRVVIYGDYDVDGMTSVAILRACLQLAGAKVEHYVPHRLEEGYGVNAEAIAKLASPGALLVTVDCGISAVEPLARAVEAGMEVIVTDHHAPPAELPAAAAIVHPALPGSTYANPNLCGAGVAFKLAWAIARDLCGSPRVDDTMRELLLNATTMAALGTIADVVPLTGENRVLAVFGLRGLSGTQHVGLRALLSSAGLDGETLDAYHVGFVLAPRLNACGRMGHAQLAVDLLTGEAGEKSLEIAEYLDKQNAERQRVERAIAAEAEQIVIDRGLDAPDCRAIVLSHDSWHGGVIGIVASRLVSRFGRPTILIAVNGDGMGHGSGRSIRGFHMRDALAVCSEHLESFGGHAMAGGLKIRPERIDAFAEAMARYAATVLTEQDLLPALRIDAETTLSALSFPVVRHLAKLAPFGEGNPSPVVALRGCKLLSPPRRMGRNGATIGLQLAQGSSRIRAVGFGMGDLADLLAGVKEIDLAAEPGLNTFNGTTSVELKLRDVTWK